MTTSDQPTVLQVDELSALRAIARGEGATVFPALRQALASKGMLDDAGGLTPAGEHAVHAGEPGTVPGIDN